MLSARFSNLRDAVQRAMASASWAERSAAAFAVEVLGKRLLSCPHTFADSWRRTLEGLEAGETAQTAEVQVSERAVREETGDDLEQESRLAHAARVIGAWLKPLALELQPEIERISLALADLRLESASSLPVADARYDAMRSLIRERLRHSDGTWRDDERLVVFTEFKTTLDYLVARLSQDFPGEGHVLRLFGTGEMDQTERTAVITAFNDPGSPVRILVATDAASEGLNLQASARYLLHFDVPWNPARLEQRNGRVDRYGQARDVTTWHFASDDDADLSFLFYVATKLHLIREDLGSVAEVFDLAVQQRLIENRAESDVRSQMELSLNRARRRAETSRDASVRSVDVTGAEQGRQLAALRRELDLDGGTLRDTFEIAIGAQAGLPRLRDDGRAGVFRLIFPVPAAWRDVVDDSLRMPAVGGRIVGALPALTFDSANCLRTIAGRTIFRPDADMALLHLWHPLLRQTLQFFSRIRFPGTASSASCWTVSRDPRVPAGVEAWVLLTLEELGVNELRETIHRWVRTVVLPVTDGRIGKPLPHEPVAEYRRSNHAPADANLESRAREVWLEVEPDLREFLTDETEALTRRLEVQLRADREAAARFEAERFQSRQGELSQLITEMRIERLEREIDALNQERAQGVLFDPEQALARLRASAEDKQAELKRLRQHIEDLRDQLNRERDRVLNLLIPRRFALRGQAQVLPVSVEIRFPEGVR